MSSLPRELKQRLVQRWARLIRDDMTTDGFIWAVEKTHGCMENLSDGEYARVLEAVEDFADLEAGRLEKRVPNRKGDQRATD